MLQSITTAADSLIATVTATTKQLDAVGTTTLAAALADLQRASNEATARLEAAADSVRTTLLCLHARLAGIAFTLSSDIGLPVATMTSSTTQPLASPPVISTPIVATVTTPAPSVDPDPSTSTVAPTVNGQRAADLSEDAAPADEVLAEVRQELKAWSTGEGIVETTTVVQSAACSPVAPPAPDNDKGAARRALVLAAKEANPDATLAQIAETTGVHPSSVHRILKHAAMQIN